MRNNNIVDEKITQEEVITQAENKVVAMGTKNPNVTNIVALVVPSRGSVSSGYGMRWGRRHDGIDIAAPMGNTISAAMDGTINYAGWENGYGNMIKINHGNGLETIYGHCSAIVCKSW